MKDELFKILEELLLKCRQKLADAQERENQAEDDADAVKLVIDMLKKEAK